MISTDLSISSAADALEAGEIVIMPTETVYGLAADASNPDAIRKLFLAKGRAPDHPIACLAADGDTAFAACPPPAEHRRIAERLTEFWPGPLTMLLPHGGRFAAELTAGSPDIGLRVPDHDLARELLGRMGRPLAVTSANLTGAPSPVDVEEARAALKDSPTNIAGALDGGPCSLRIASSVVRPVAGQANTIQILRAGALENADFIRIGLTIA